MTDVDRVAPEELVPRWRAIIEAQRQHIMRLEGENERLREVLRDIRERIQHTNDGIGSAHNSTWAIADDIRTALSHSAPKEGT